MGSNGARALVAVLAVGVAIVLFVVLSGNDDDSSTTTSTTSTTTAADTGGAGGGQDKPDKPDKPEVAVIEIKGGQPVGGVRDLTFKAGEDIRFDVTSDEAYEIHFHGYDVSEEVEAGGEVSFDVPADIEGVFEVEIEDTVTPIAEVTVEP
jgi:hypothetical protein